MRRVSVLQSVIFGHAALQHAVAEHQLGCCDVAQPVAQLGLYQPEAAERPLYGRAFAFG